jgi:hypothetical protein
MNRTAVVEVPEEVRLKLRRVAKARTQANLATCDNPDYDHNRYDLTSEQANYLGVMAEMAVIIYGELDVTDPDVWNMYVDPSRADYKEQIARPDILNTFEVRRVSQTYNPLVVRTKDVAVEAIMVSVFLPYTIYGSKLIVPEPIIAGWLPAREAWDKGTVPEWSKDGDSRGVSLSETRPAGSLLGELHKVDAYRLEFENVVSRGK